MLSCILLDAEFSVLFLAFVTGNFFYEVPWYLPFKCYYFCLSQYTKRCFACLACNVQLVCWSKSSFGVLYSIFWNVFQYFCYVFSSSRFLLQPVTSLLASNHAVSTELFAWHCFLFLMYWFLCSFAWISFWSHMTYLTLKNDDSCNNDLPIFNNRPHLLSRLL